MSKTLEAEHDIDTLLPDRETLAKEITEKWERWLAVRVEAEALWTEGQKFIYSTDTRDTSVGINTDHSNSTTRPKLTNIRDNLHSNIMAALFPNDQWLSWEGSDQDSAAKEKRELIEAYMTNKLNASKFKTTVSRLVFDWIDYGNCFADVIMVKETKKDSEGNDQIIYEGPKAIRISPYDIVFDPTVNTFEESPKITRTIKSVGDLLLEAQERPEEQYKNDIVDKIKNNRQRYHNSAHVSMESNGKPEPFMVGGYGNIEDYYSSGMVELIEFDGNIYDAGTDTLHTNVLVTVVDRSYIVRIVPQPSWVTKSYKRHVGWRLRADNLWAMGPLDNLIGMQYRIDHLENAKADVVDLIAHPIVKLRGDPVWDGWYPGSVAELGEDDDVSILTVPTELGYVDLQIEKYERIMEEFAGTPRDAAGFRTPGEKTKFEVQQLSSGGARIFQNKTAYFEEIFIEPLVNSMFEASRRNIGTQEQIRLTEESQGTAVFQDITKDDLKANGMFYPRGSRRFASKAILLQEMSSFNNSAMGQDLTVKAHISGYQIAQLFEEAMGIEKYGIVGKNIGILEQADTQRVMQQAQNELQEEAEQDLTPTDEDLDQEAGIPLDETDLQA